MIIFLKNLPLFELEAAYNFYCKSGKTSKTYDSKIFDFQYYVIFVFKSLFILRFRKQFVN